MSSSNFILNILGTASALPVIDRYPTAQALDVHGRLFVIDCGEGAQMRMRKYGISPLKVEVICISHLHGDHVFGLYGLLSTMQLLSRQTSLTIFGPTGLADYIGFFLHNLTEELRFPLELHEVGQTSGEWPRLIYGDDDMEILAFPLRHRIPTLGYLFREKPAMLNVDRDAVARHSLTVPEILALKEGNDVLRSDGSTISASDVTYTPWKPRSYAFCSDTVPFPELPLWVAGVDLLYHEATYPQAMADKAETNWHSTTIQAAQCARDAGVGKLVVGHYSSRFQDISFFLDEIRAIFPNSFLSHDGDVIEIPRLR